ncbi:MAG: hypothetical protein HY861_00965 [Chlamydiia bacterium]|nr:hypothetical protein [Chlamydiia bacterium]
MVHKQALAHSWKIALLACMAGIVFLWLVKAPLFGAYLTHKLRVPVSVDWIGIWPKQTHMYGFRVKNPREFKNLTAFKASKIDASYALSQLLGPTTVIDQLEIQQSFLSVDFTNHSSNNWTVIAQRMPKNRSLRHVTIRKLVLVDFNLEVHGASLFGEVEKRHFDRLELTDIDGVRGFPTSGVIQKIFHEAGIGSYIEGFFNPVDDIEVILSPLRIF